MPGGNVAVRLGQSIRRPAMLRGRFHVAVGPVGPALMVEPDVGDALPRVRQERLNVALQRDALQQRAAKRLPLHRGAVKRSRKVDARRSDRSLVMQ